MRLRSLKHLHRKFLAEAYAAWDPVTPDQVDDMSNEDIKRMFQQAYNDIFKMAGGQLGLLADAFRVFKSSSFYQDLMDDEYGKTLRDMLEDFFYSGSSVTYASEPIRSEYVPTVKKVALLNSFQRSLEEMEKIINDLAKKSPDDVADKLVEMLDSLPKDAVRLFIRHLAHADPGGLDIFAYVDPDDYGRSIRKVFDQPKYARYSIGTFEKALIDTQDILKTFKPVYESMSGEGVPEPIKKTYENFVSVLRLYSENPDIKVDKGEFKSSVLTYSRDADDVDSIDEILDIPKDDPDLGPKSLARVKNYVARRFLVDRPLHPDDFSYLLERLKKRKRYAELVRDDRFMTLMANMSKLAAETQSFSSKLMTKVMNMIDDEAGPASRDWGKFSRILTMMREDPEFRDLDVIKGITGAKDFLETSRQIWDDATDEEKDAVAGIVKDVSKRALESAEQERAERRKQHPPEAPEDADFRPLDDYAFANDRSDARLPDEEDNDEEKELHRSLKKHFNNNTPLSGEQAELITQIMKKGFYKDTFHEPEQEWIFRGMSVSDEWLRKFIGIGLDEDLPPRASRTGSFTFSPREKQGSTSWSIDRDKALTFSDDNDHVVLLIAATKKNPYKFVTSPGGLYNVKGFTTHEHEAEAIGLGPIEVSRIFWKPQFDRTKLSPKTPEEEPV